MPNDTYISANIIMMSLNLTWPEKDQKLTSLLKCTPRTSKLGQEIPTFKMQNTTFD